MGNDCCSNRTHTYTTFNEAERNILRDLYDDLTGLHRAKGSTRFNKNTLTYLFQENPDMGLAIYNFMQATSTSDGVSYEAFEQALEVLIQDNKAYQLKEYRTYDKIDMLALLMLDDFTLTKEDFQKISISYIQAFNFVRNLLKIFQFYSTVARPIDEYAIKVVVDSAFGFLISHGINRPDWFNFLQYIRQNFIYANRCLKMFFTAKFLSRKAELILPELSKASHLLNRDFIGLLFLSNIYMGATNRLQFLYSSQYTGFTFQRIVQALDDFHGSTYIIMKVIPVQEGGYGGKEDEFSVIGGFSRLPWKTNGDYGGDSDCYVFSMVPTFRNYFPIEGDRYYTYLKVASGPGAGLGFGGSGANDFRIWIDGNDLNRSYVRSEDRTYAPGPLLNVERSYIKILDMEIWGLNQELETPDTTVMGNRTGNEQFKRKIFAEDALDHAMNSFESRLDQISQNRRNRDLVDTREDHQGVKKSYQTPSREINEIHSRAGEHERRAAHASNDFMIPGRKTTPNVAFDYDIAANDRGRASYIEPKEYYNPFKNDYKGKDTSAFASPPRLSRGSRGSPPYS